MNIDAYKEDLVTKCERYMKMKRMCRWTRRSVLDNTLWRINVFGVKDVEKHLADRAREAKSTHRHLTKDTQLKLTPIWLEEHLLCRFIVQHIKKHYPDYESL